MRPGHISIITLILITIVATLHGCPSRRAQQGSLDQLAVVQYRYAIDEDSEIVRVIGSVRNTGELTTPAAEVVVTLRSRTGSMKGQNRVALEPISAGESASFALPITAHGSVESVEIEIVEAGLADESDGAETPADAAGNGAAGERSSDGDDDQPDEEA